MAHRKPPPRPDRPSPRAKATAGAVFGAVSADLAWTPQINCYQTPKALQVCVNLAGVPKEQIAVTVEPGRLVITGVRLVPEPADRETHCIRVMEIDHGRFERTVPLPEHIDLERVTSRYVDGLLWVELPLRPESV